MLIDERVRKKGFEGVAVVRMVDPNARRIVELMPYGLTVLDVTTPDRDGTPTQVVLGYDSLEDYKKDRSYQGRGAVGRVANRIGNAQFVGVDGQVVRLVGNDGPDNRNQLHGGPKGWSSRNHRYIGAENKGDKIITSWELISPDGEQGFPGMVNLTSLVSLSEDGSLTFEYSANTTKPTPINTTMHSYWNLNGSRSKTDVLNHMVQSNAVKYVKVDGQLIPVGALPNVAGTRYDFVSEVQLGLPWRFGEQGYDNCLVFPVSSKQGLVMVRSPDTGITLDVITDRPSTQLYTGFFLDGKPAGRFGALCVEPGQLVDADR